MSPHNGLMRGLKFPELYGILDMHVKYLDIKRQWNLFVLLERLMEAGPFARDRFIYSSYVVDILHARYALKLLRTHGMLLPEALCDDSVVIDAAE